MSRDTVSATSFGSSFTSLDTSMTKVCRWLCSSSVVPAAVLLKLFRMAAAVAIVEVAGYSCVAHF